MFVSVGATSQVHRFLKKIENKKNKNKVFFCENIIRKINYLK